MSYGDWEIGFKCRALVIFDHTELDFLRDMCVCGRWRCVREVVDGLSCLDGRAEIDECRPCGAGSPGVFLDYDGGARDLYRSVSDWWGF